MNTPTTANGLTVSPTGQSFTGNYTLEFQADGAPFYRFAFAVSTAPSCVPRSPK